MPTYDDGSTPTLVTEKPPAIAVRTAQTTANGCGVSDELAHTIDTTGPEAIAYAVRMRAGCDGGGKGALVQEGVSGTLATGNDQTVFQPESSGYVVRRLTPLECERLQGFPDGHTNLTGCDPKQIYTRMPQWLHGTEKERKAIEQKVKSWCGSTPDGLRYKAIGNSIATPCLVWIGRRLQEVDEILWQNK